MTSIKRDLRSGIRQLLVQPLGSAVAILSLAIALGAGTLLYSAVNALLLSATPGISEPERQVEIGRYEREGDLDTLNYPGLQDIAAQARTLDRVWGFAFLPLNVALDGRPVRAAAFAVSASYFDALGVGASAGRLLADSDDVAGAAPVAMVSHAAFQRLFGGRADAIGGPVAINGRSFTLVGVVEPGFRGHVAALAPDFFVPVTQAVRLGRASPEALESYRSYWVLAGGRLAPGRTLEEARSELKTIATRILAAHPEASSDTYQIGAHPLRALPAGFRGPLGLLAAFLAALVGLVLLVACSNVAGLLLARGEQRQREIAMRRVLGARRAVIVRQLLVEAALLAVLAAVSGLVLAVVGRDLIVSLPIPSPVPVALQIPFAPSVAAFGVAAAVLSTLLFGLAPALRASDAAPQRALSQSGGAGKTARMRLRSALVGAQIAFTLLLLIVSALIVRALDRTSSIDPGYRIDGIVSADLDLSPTGYAEERLPGVVDAVLEAVAAVPGVERAAAAGVLPLSNSRMGMGAFMADGRDPVDSDVNIVAGAFFETLEIPVRGRRFADTDTASAPGVVIVNETLARRLSPDRDVLGQHFRLGGAGDFIELTVVGVTPDGRYSDLGDADRAFAFLPQTQVRHSGMNLLLRTGLPLPQLERQLAAAISAADPALPAPTVQRLEDIAALALLPQRIASAAAGALGAVGVLLAALGLYGLLAGYVASHIREIGIRLALGAARRRIAGQVIRRAAIAVGAGMLVGIAGGIAFAQVLSANLPGVDAADIGAFAIGLGTVLAGTAVAVLAPLRRAVGIQPMQALRHD